MNIKIITGSVREGRFNDKAADWIAGELEKQEGVSVEVLDLKEYDMPFFDAPVSPSMKSEPYTNEVVEAFTSKIAEGDAFIMVTPEYNHSTSAVLKNAIDWVGKEWNNKPVAFVGYGSAGGSRAIEHLRQIIAELQMTPVRNAVHIPGHQYFPVLMGQADAGDLFASFEEDANALTTQLLWWAKALKDVRENT